MEMQNPAPIPDTFDKLLCRFLRECTATYDAIFAEKKPSRDWCQSPSKSPNFPNQATERGNTIDSCCKEKIQIAKKKSGIYFSESVKTDQPVKVLGGTCFPDLTVGAVPNCQGIWGFKTSCPLPKGAPPPMWPIYGTKVGFTRKVKIELGMASLRKRYI